LAIRESIAPLVEDEVLAPRIRTAAALIDGGRIAAIIRATISDQTQVQR
jgi:hypothetical protein